MTHHEPQHAISTHGFLAAMLILRLLAARDVERCRGPHKFVHQVQAFTAHGAIRAATFAWNCPDGGVCGGPEYAGPAELQDPLCFLAFGRSDHAASSLRTEDHSALKVPALPRGLLRRAGRPGCSSARRCWPRFPWSSLVFLFVPSRPLSRLLRRGTPRAGCGVPAGQRPVALVGVTVSWFRTSRTGVSRHAGLMSPEIPD
jgi:hypothetical protein